MDRRILISIWVLILAFSVHTGYSQDKKMPKQNKWGYVDTNFILGKMPEYQKVQQEVNLLSNGWKQELKAKYLQIDSLYQDYQEEAVLLTTEEKEKRITELRAKEDSLQTYREEIFGFDGVFFQKKQEMLKTVQDRLFDAIEIVAKEFNLHTIFDKAGDQNVIYVNPIHDYSDYVLEKLELGDPNDNIR